MRPELSQVMMGVATMISSRSSCSRRKVGCVITDSSMSQIYSIGYNGNYRGGPNDCDRTQAGNCGCLHAEDNALVKLRTEAHNLRLFTTLSPCMACAKRIINQGHIRSVYYSHEYRDTSPLDILIMDGITLEYHNDSH